MNWMRVALIVVNFLFWLCGVVLLGVGIWVRVDPDITRYVEHLLPPGSDVLFHAAGAIIAIGVFIFLISFLGCFGAYRENVMMITIYASVIFLVLVLCIAAIAMAAVFKDRLANGLGALMAKHLQHDVSPVGQGGPISKTWHLLQRYMECCGYIGYQDYVHNDHFNQTTNPVPMSCCRPTSAAPSGDSVAPPYDLAACLSEARTNAASTQQLRASGCQDKFLHFIESRSTVLIAIGVVIMLLQICGLVFACCLRKQIQSPQHKYQVDKKTDNTNPETQTLQ